MTQQIISVEQFIDSLKVDVPFDVDYKQVYPLTDCITESEGYCIICGRYGELGNGWCVQCWDEDAHTHVKAKIHYSNRRK